MNSRIKIGLAAGALGLGVTAAVGYYMYKQKKIRDETDEGIGDVDSIISDSEVEDRGTDSPIRNSKTDLSEPVVLQSSTTGVRSAQNRANSSSSPTHQHTVENHQTNIPDPKDSVKILVLGLDQSGKTSLIETLAKVVDRNIEYKPTKGFNVAQTVCGEHLFHFTEVGGTQDMRQYWPQFVQDTQLFIYIVDSTQPDKFTEAKEELKTILKRQELHNVPCLLLANKQDIKGAMSADKIFKESELKKFCPNASLRWTLLDTICTPIEEKSEINYSDTIMGVILSILFPKVKK